MNFVEEIPAIYGMQESNNIFSHVAVCLRENYVDNGHFEVNCVKPDTQYIKA